MRVLLHGEVQGGEGIGQYFAAKRLVRRWRKLVVWNHALETLLSIHWFKLGRGAVIHSFISFTLYQISLCLSELGETRNAGLLILACKAYGD